MSDSVERKNAVPIRGHRPAVTETQLRMTASRNEGGNTFGGEGAGNWRCTVSWHLPDVDLVATAIYQLDVTPDRRCVADGAGPKERNS